MDYKFSDRVKHLSGNAIREIFKLVARPEVISFAGGFPAADCLPIDLVNKYSAEILSSDYATKILQYGATEGYAPLKAELIKYIERVGIQGVDEDNLLVISGGQQGIDLAFKCFINKGDKILVEAPTYLAALHISKTYEANTIGIKSGDDGLDLNVLEEALKEHQPKIFYIVPNFQNPTGRTLSLEKRKAVAEICAKYEVMVLEDDPYRELRYSGEALPSIKSFDTAGNVIYISSFSKTISPALRVGVAVADKTVIRRFTIGKQATDVHTSTLSQAIVEKFLKTGTIHEVIAKALPIYKERRDAMLKAIEKFMPKDFVFTNPEGGIFVWGEYRGTKEIDTSKLFYEALKYDVAFVGGSDFFADGKGKNTLRLNFSSAGPQRITEGIEKLAKALKI